MPLLTGYLQWVTVASLVTLLKSNNSYMKGDGEVELFVFLVLVVMGLAIFGALAAAYGTDSRETIEDAHIRDLTRRTI